MGMSENGVYPPTKHFHWENDQNIIGIGGTLFSDIHMYSLFTCCFPVVNVGNDLERLGGRHIRQLELRIEFPNRMIAMKK